MDCDQYVRNSCSISFRDRRPDHARFEASARDAERAVPTLDSGPELWYRAYARAFSITSVLRLSASSNRRRRMAAALTLAISISSSANRSAPSASRSFALNIRFACTVSHSGSRAIQTVEYLAGPPINRKDEPWQLGRLRISILLRRLAAGPSATAAATSTTTAGSAATRRARRARRLNFIGQVTINGSDFGGAERRAERLP